jgi:hypothetical protein
MTGPRDQGPQGQETLVRAAVLPCTSVNNERQRTSEEVRPARRYEGGWRLEAGVVSACLACCLASAR